MKCAENGSHASGRKKLLKKQKGGGETTTFHCTKEICKKEEFFVFCFHYCG